MSDAAMMNGAEWLARALASTGMSHVFFVESTMRRTLLQLSDHGVKPILAHSEKAAAYARDEPMKSLLIAAAAGALLMGLVSLMARSDD